MNQTTTNRKQLAEEKPFLSNRKSGFFCFYDSICPAFFFFSFALRCICGMSFGNSKRRERQNHSSDNCAIFNNLLYVLKQRSKGNYIQAFLFNSTLPDD